MTRHLWLSLALLGLNACDTEGGTDEEACIDTQVWWTFKEDGVLIAQGDLAQVMPATMGLHISGAFSTLNHGNTSCTFT